MRAYSGSARRLVESFRREANRIVFPLGNHQGDIVLGSHGGTMPPFAQVEKGVAARWAASCTVAPAGTAHFFTIPVPLWLLGRASGAAALYLVTIWSSIVPSPNADTRHVRDTPAP